MRYDNALNVEWYGTRKNGPMESDSAAFQAAVNTGNFIIIPSGHYYFDVPVVIPPGGDLLLCGQGDVVITAASGISAFTTKQDYPFTFARRIDVSGITFDGQRERRAFPYMDSNGDTYGMFTALFAAADPNAASSIRIRNCVFKDTASLPVLFDHFKDVYVTDNLFERTRDPGFRFCDNVIFSNNITRFGSDNGVSISRGCRNVTITGNIMQDCEAAGIWLSGFDVSHASAGRTFKITGADYDVGSQVTVAISGSSFFRAKHIKTPFTVTDANGNQGVVQLISITGGNAATATVLKAIPIGARDTALSNFQEAPHNGVQYFAVTGNTVIGGYIAGIHAIEGVRNGTITGNIVLRSGYLGDSEVSTRGTVLAGSTDLTVTSAVGFTVNDTILLQPANGLFIEQTAVIKAINGSTFVLHIPVAVTLVDVTVRLCHIHTSSGYGMFIAGQVTGIPQPAEHILIGDNVIDQYVNYGIVLGTGSTYPVRYVTISDNRFSLSQDLGVNSKSAVHISEAVGTSTANVVIKDNTVDNMHLRIVNMLQRGDSLRSICIRDNIADVAVSSLRAVDVDRSSAVVTGYKTTQLTPWGEVI